MTKTEMAQRIVQALYNMPEMPTAAHWRVKRCARQRKDIIIEQYARAERVLAERK